MKNRVLISSILMASVGASAPVYATNDGHLDGVWLSGRITTTIPKAINTSGPSPWAQLKNLKIDSGINNCYAQLTWAGEGSYVYQLVSYCMNGNGQWERGEYSSELWELNDSRQSLGSDWGSIYFVQQGKAFHGFPANYAFIGYEGSLEFMPKYNQKGSLSGISVGASSGMIYSWDSGSKIGGTSRSGGLKLRFVNTDQVPQGAINCAAGASPLCVESES